MTVDSAEDLYGLALERFIAERTALVKALRGGQRRQEASEVAARRKPSLAAWAVNQLVRSQPQALQALFSAGDDLARAQARAAAGKGGGDAMRDASRRQREAVGELLQAAEGLLSADGHALSPAVLERVGETLRAAAVDEGARRQVAGGCLTQELRSVGVGFGASAPASPPRDRADEAALTAARRAEAQARRGAARAEKELAAARARREKAAAALEDAEGGLSAAADAAEAAGAELAGAEQAVRDLAES